MHAVMTCYVAHLKVLCLHISHISCITLDIGVTLIRFVSFLVNSDTVISFIDFCHVELFLQTTIFFRI